MSKLSVVLVLLTLTACAAPFPQRPQQPVDSTTAACAGGEMSYACQVERYNNVAF